jgi:hypothetical protein
MPIFMRLGERLNAYREPKPRTTGHIKGVRISNIAVEAAKGGRLAAPTAIVMTGERTDQTTHLIEDVRFKNVKINIEGGGRIESVGTVLERTRNNNYPEYPFFFAEDAPSAFPAYGIYARHVRGVTFENVEITTRQRDTRPLIFLENAHDIQQDGLTSPPAAATPEKLPPLLPSLHTHPAQPSPEMKTSRLPVLLTLQLCILLSISLASPADDEALMKKNAAEQAASRAVAWGTKGPFRMIKQPCGGNAGNSHRDDPHLGHKRLRCFSKR